MSNKNNRRRIPIIISLLMIVAILLVACNNAPAATSAPAPTATATQAPKVIINSPTPAPTAAKKDEAAQKRPMAIDFTVTDLLTGEEFSLSDYRGKIVFLNFWGSWCPPCRAEMPAFEEVYEHYKDDGVVIIGIGVNDSDENLITFAKSIGITYPIANDSTTEISRQYRIHSLPTTYRINQKGEIQGVAPGGLSQAQLIQAIEELMPAN